MKQIEVNYRLADGCGNCMHAENFGTHIFRKCIHFEGGEIYVFTNHICMLWEREEEKK